MCFFLFCFCTTHLWPPPAAVSWLADSILNSSSVYHHYWCFCDNYRDLLSHTHTHTHTVARWTDVVQQQMCNVRPSISEVSSSWQDKWLSEWQIDAASAFISAHFHPFIFLYFLTSTLNASFFVFSLPSLFLSSFPSSPLILFLVVLSHLFHSSFTLFSLCFTPPPPFFSPLRAFYYHFLWPPLVIRRFPTPSSHPHISQPERLKWNIINNPVYWNLLSAVSLSLFNKRLVTVFPI